MNPEPAGWEPPEPNGLQRWVRRQPGLAACGAGLLMLCWGMIVFGDIRGALAGGVLSGLVFFLGWRPGGFAYRLEAKNIEVLRETGGKAVRWNWLARQAAVVVAVVAGLAVLLLLLGQVGG